MDLTTVIVGAVVCPVERMGVKGQLGSCSHLRYHQVEELLDQSSHLESRHLPHFRYPQTPFLVTCVELFAATWMRGHSNDYTSIRSVESTQHFPRFACSFL